MKKTLKFVLGAIAIILMIIGVALENNIGIGLFVLGVIILIVIGAKERWDINKRIFGK